MATIEAMTDDEIGEDFEYRPLSVGAIASAIFGVLSYMIFVVAGSSLQSALMLSPLPAIGFITGLSSLRNIQAMPNQMSGKGVALTGLVLSTISLVGGIGYAGYIHATEVPDGYTRTSFVEFRPDEVEERGGKAVPPNVEQLNEQKVFIKGYMRPGTHVSKSGNPVRHNVSRFLLVRDNNQCCFGDISTVKYYDQVLVQLVGNKMTDYSSRMFRIGGTLRVIPQNANRMGQPVYTLEADYVQ